MVNKDQYYDGTCNDGGFHDFRVRLFFETMMVYHCLLDGSYRVKLLLGSGWTWVKAVFWVNEFLGLSWVQVSGKCFTAKDKRCWRTSKTSHVSDVQIYINLPFFFGKGWWKSIPSNKSCECVSSCFFPRNSDNAMGWIAISMEISGS